MNDNHKTAIDYWEQFKDESEYRAWSEGLDQRVEAERDIREGEVSNEQSNVNEVPITNRFGIPGRWSSLPVDEPASRKEIGNENVASAGRTSSIPDDKGVFHFQELLNMKIERPGDIVQGLVCERQNVLLMGRFGVGKTMFGTQLSLHLAIGREFLGLNIPHCFRTMYLDFENDLGDIKNRLSTQQSGLALKDSEKGLLNTNWIYVDAGDEDNAVHGTKLDTVDRSKLKPLITLLEEHKPEVLVIDNLGLVATKGDIKDTEDAAQFYENLKYLRSNVESVQNSAIIVFHHLTKPGGDQSTSPISLLGSPYEYISRARGTGRVLDFARSRLALAEEMIGNKKCHVVNGINRSATVSPLILQFNPETLSFERHEDIKFRFDAVFAMRPRGRDIYRQLPEEFTFTDAAKLVDPTTGKLVNKGTLSETLKTAVQNDFIRYDKTTRVYKKVLDPQSD